MPIPPVVSFEEKLAHVSETWSPAIVGQLNDYTIKVVKIEGDFVWHSHEETDEAFIVLQGEMAIDFREGPAVLRAGEMLVVPRGVEHKPRAEHECHMMLIEPAGTLNTGDAGGERTVRDPKRL
jgi:mannose-6-phosphate isomerase-like protein (cupin superfamily)